MRLTFYSSAYPHYIDYLAPLYNALPEELIGEFYTRGDGAVRAADYGITVNTTRMRREDDALYIVAGAVDAQRVSPSPCVLVNHGIGQRYSSDASSYSGGRGRENVVLHLCPSETDAAINSVFADAEAVGPYKLDPWISGTRWRSPDWTAISFHHDANLHDTPEGQSAFDHYYEELIELSADWESLHLIGHAHPRAPNVENFWSRHNVPFAPHFDLVLDNAAVYVCDNSSTLFEAAAVGIPVVVLDAPWYRPEIHHGGRFWDWADVGIRIQDPTDLRSAIDRARTDPLHVRSRRLTIIDEVYTGLADGKALDRAVRALMRFCGYTGHETQRHRA